MQSKHNKTSKLAISLLGIFLGMLVTLTILELENSTTFQATKNLISNSTPSVTVTSVTANNILAPKTISNVKVANAYESINNRVASSVNDKVSNYKIKSCTNLNHSDGEVLKFCIAEFNGNTTGFYDSAEELMVVSSFENTLLIHEIFHATSLHFIKKGLTDFAGHEAQEKMAYNAEFLYSQIISYKGDLITLETSKKLNKYYKKNS